MRRTALTLIVAAGLSAWAAAQTTPVTSAAVQGRLFAENRDLLQSLLSDGLAVGKDGDAPLDRIAACRRAAKTLTRALESACRDEAADRVAELGDHLGEVLKDGLEPALAAARSDSPVGSPGHPEFVKQETESAADARTAVGLIPEGGKFGDRPDVRAARGKLAAAAGRLRK